MRSSFTARTVLPLFAAVLAATLTLFGTHASAQLRSEAKPAPINILLVGASGMIGSRILSEAASRGHHVTAAARHPEKIATGANITAVKLDATDAAALTALAQKADNNKKTTNPHKNNDPIK